MGAMSLDIVDAGLVEPQTEEVVDYEVDSDVKTEEERVLSAPIPSGQPDEDVIHIRKLRKVYGGGDSIDLMLFGIAFLVAFVLCLITRMPTQHNIFTRFLSFDLFFFSY